ncbi:MAG: hypothetical protein J6386_19840 [Candidatus Synoicihabitans palmerolidicus]|nr:hypothetical protein [Candidatus Synoicihabitans palmerolidicus]
MCRNQEILPVSASLFLRYLLFSKLLRLWDTLHISRAVKPLEPSDVWPPLQSFPDPRPGSLPP